MARNPRYIPPGGALVEVTCRTFQGRLLLRPSRELNEIIVGVLARAREASALRAVEIIGAVFLSNHYHLLLEVEEAADLSRFMEYLNGNLAREICRLHDWSEAVWSGRYRAVLVSPEEEAQPGRLRYLLSQGVKEGLVAKPQHWPGVHCARALLEGKPLEGFWFDRSRESTARRRGRRPGRYDFAEPVRVAFAKLPCWRHLSDREYRQRVVELVEDIERQGAAARRANSTGLPGAKALRRQDPHTPVRLPAKRPLPFVHAFRQRVRREMRQAFALFLTAYREAAARLRDGERHVRFPRGCFPPGLPYIPARSGAT